MALSDVTAAELLAEEATNADLLGPDARTMIKISEASFCFDDKDFAQEFLCDSDGIEVLGTFRHVDEKGFNWGLNMQKRSDKVLELPGGGETLRVARVKALKITKEIQGFGSATASPSTASSSDSSRASSFGSYFSASTCNDINDLNKLETQIVPTKEPIQNYSKGGIQEEFKTLEFPSEDENFNWVHLWNCPPTIQEKGCLLEAKGERMKIQMV
ncbi:hypothetical protein CRYUN_Cryun18bG0026900 [Craigia yunnanensis]